MKENKEENKENFKIKKNEKNKENKQERKSSSETLLNHNFFFIVIFQNTHWNQML